LSLLLLFLAVCKPNPRWLSSKTMPEAALRQDSLVLYKSRPARVASLSDKKIEIQTEQGETVSVRPKDVTLLHPGPVRTVADLKTPPGEVTAAWELLAGETTTLPDLAELAYDAFTPATAWATYQLLVDGLLFSGVPDEIIAHTPERVAALQAAREAKAAEDRAWQAFLVRVQSGHYAPEDERYLTDVVALALEQRDQSRVLRTLGREETPQNAHALLLSIGYWTPAINPYPQRLGAHTTPPDIDLPALPEEDRRDLTHLAAFAIDDEGALDPDDAISWEDGRLWVHVADVAALVPPDSAADQEARSRGANLYLPEGVIPMLPPAATTLLALGLADISPALSFGLDLAPDGSIANVEITPSWVRVTRLTYQEAEDQLNDPHFEVLRELAEQSATRRLANGAIELELPEVKTRVHEGQVVIQPLPRLHSREVVREAMLLTGVAVADYAQRHNLIVPYSVQEAPEELLDLTDGALSMMFAQRRLLKPSQPKTTPGPHSGLGLDRYVQATSPLRRYADLVVHQQLRAHLRGSAPLDQSVVMARMAEASAGGSIVRRTERLANTHWKLVYLLQNPTWRGEGVVVEKVGNRCVVLIPELELETQIYGRPHLALDSVVDLAIGEVNLPALEASFRVL
jgi:exoribonuclease-2